MVHTIIIPKPAALSRQDISASDSERERLHRQMLSSVSHDLKTPLASIIGALEVLDRMKDKLSDDKKLDLSYIALREAYRLDNYITNILDMAKLENNMVKAKREKAEAGDIIRHCLKKMNNQLRDSKVNLKTSAQIDVLTDPVLLCRAICLVLDNAVHYGGAPPAIDIDYGKDERDSCFIGVRDHGGGIAAARMEIIFSKYTRFGKEDQQNAGTGLGLPIGRAIMNLLGGDITAANHPDGGALFTLRFPLQGF